MAQQQNGSQTIIQTAAHTIHSTQKSDIFYQKILQHTKVLPQMKGIFFILLLSLSETINFEPNYQLK